MDIDLVSQLLADVFASSQQHHRVLLEEERVVNVSVSSTHRTLVDNHVLSTPDLQHRHTCNGTFGVLQSRGVDDIISTNDQHHVHFREVVIDFLHLLDDVVRNANFGQKNVHLTRHTTGNGVDGEPHVDFVFDEMLGEFSDRVLSLCDSHSVARNNHHLLTIDKKLCHLFWVCFNVLSLLDGLSFGGTRSPGSEDHIFE
jgi:hypothetical protein